MRLLHVLQNQFANETAKIVWITIWVLSTGAYVVNTFVKYAWPSSPAVQDKLAVLGWSLPFARSAASGIKINSALILLFVMRNLLSWARDTVAGTVFPVDKAIVFHRYVGGAIGVFSLIHVGAHASNFCRLSMTAGGPTLMDLNYKTIYGATGVALVLVMALMYSAALHSVRSPSFEIFYVTHLAFIFYYILGSFHGAAVLLQPPDFYIWTLGPLVAYLIERVIRFSHAKRPCVIYQAIVHPSDVLEIRIKKAAFVYKPGQYVFVLVPYLSRFEWHPFTISSAPHEDFVSIHIRRLGDWTTDLLHFFNPENRLGIVQENTINAPNGKPIMLIDGPFGAASEDFTRFEHIHLWAAGIGATPFSSVLKHLKHAILGGACLTKTVELYWIARESSGFEWFLDTVSTLKETCDFFSVNIYFTQKGTAADGDLEGAAKLYVPPSLASSIKFARPDIPAIFRQKGQEYRGCKVGVFFCGPPVVSKQLYAECVKTSKMKNTGTFVYNKENF